ncbi:MAG TPA: response regulator transcription factor [Acidimicrobiales bacterium]|nr:response regulator transcription factor [Acidimicrobiales bacterium]
MRVLVAEDDAALRSVLERGLREVGYTVDAVSDGEEALRFLRAYDYSAAVLDWRMPRLSGVDVVQEARRSRLGTPILMLTARDTTDDRVSGLDAGADDYLVKPFDFAELLARIRALLRRPADVGHPMLECGDVSMDPSRHEVTVGRDPVTLTSTEFAILELLLRRTPRVVERRSIALQVWDEEADALGSNTIDVHMARLRAKLAHGRARIETVRGVGYRIGAA